MVSWPLTLYDPADDPLYQLATAHLRTYSLVSRGLWALALIFAAGDVVTTWIAVTPLLGGPSDFLFESMPLTRWVLATVGPFGFVVQKAVILTAIWWVSRWFPRPYPLGIVLVVVWANYLPTSNNLAVLLDAGMLELSTTETAVVRVLLG